MNKLQVDMNYLIFAWLDESPDTAYYLDTDTGSVILIQRDLEDVGELRDEIELGPNRYLYVPKPHPDQLELDLSDFIFTVPDPQIKAMLSVACEGSNKVAACKSIMSKHEGELVRWENWRKGAVKERVRRWLAANDLEAVD